MRIGIQTALQDTEPSQIVSLWQTADQLGFEWVSGWDHFQGVGGGTQNLDGVVLHTMAAATTTRARVGSLTYCVDYRSIGVLAKSIATIDHISKGRATLGLGAGYLEAEYRAWGYRLDPPGTRLDRLEEMMLALRHLFAGEYVTTEGPHITLNGAVCDPRPIQDHLPIWIGGGGEQRTIPLAARLADGWNIPMADLDTFSRKAALVNRVLSDHGRDRSAFECSVNLGLCWDDRLIPERYGPRAEQLRPAILTGEADQVLERLAAYSAAGADWVMLSMRAPFDVDDLHRFAEEVLPAVSEL